ncbi:hypothetical protein HY492_03970 [Candidatus Woesearchaeota archaeon]|nr:hypothetical protein [Candidatus Woesearchaeota archaeon]
MVLDYRDKVLAFVRAKGPILPVHIAKEVGTNILMASAMLSELVSKGSLKVSGLKVGGSPLYFAPGQEAMLLNFTASLNEKDRRTVELLQQQKVLRDNEQEALTRVSLRGIKDFAFALNVTHDGITEIFWKWYALPDAEASDMIRTALEPPQPIVRLPPASVPRSQPSPVANVAEMPVKPVELRKKPRKIIKPKELDVQKPLLPKPAVPKTAPKQPVALSSALTPTLVPPAPIVAPIPSLLDDPALSDSFFQELQAFCAKGNLKILEHVMIKKKQDYDLILEVPSPVGSFVCYAKARNKNKLTDADLMAAFTQGQLKKLPAVLLAPGELSKKGQDLLAKELRGLVFTRLGGQP